jgi:hypothetical protein
MSRRGGTRALSFVLVTTVIALFSAAIPVAANEALEWNSIALDVAIAGGQNPIIQSRTMTMVHLAMHDALNAIAQRYEPYVFHRRAERGTAPAAAIATATRDVLAALLPNYGTAAQRQKAQEMLDQAYAAALSKTPDSPQKGHGIAIGRAAATAMLTARKNDGADRKPSYSPRTAAGHWRPHPNPVPANPPIADAALAPGNWPAILPQWAEVTPFVMTTPWQFRLPGPPALASEQYARDFNEVRRLGGKTSADRTAPQAEIAHYWYESSPAGWSRIARVVAAQRGSDVWDSARLLALVNAAIADGYIAGADTRYLYDFWRPVTAIRAAETDGNDATAVDGAWESFLNTPPLPDYPSTHSVAGGAAAVVLARFFGSDQVAFTMTSGPPFAGITRSFSSFSQAAQENADSRVYAGIHFRTACQDGIKLGESIGRRTFIQHLQPYNP